MRRLTDKTMWDALYQKTRDRRNRRNPGKDRGRSGFRRSFPLYSDYLLWNVLFKRYLPNRPDAKVLEVGSAPGEFLVQLHKTYGYIPYGVEYSEVGADQNRELFSRNGIDPGNVVCADFFDGEYQRGHAGAFDVVISRGFIEHFTDVESVIARHVDVLAEGGTLVVSIPNLDPHSLYGACASLFHQERLARHNLSIMSKDVFVRLFDRQDLSALFYGHYGTLCLSLISPGNVFLTRLAVWACCKCQRVVDPLLRMLLGNRGTESRTFSPFLIYVGTKKRGV